MTNNDIYSQLGRIVALGGAGNSNKPVRADNTTKTADTTQLTADYAK